MSYMVIFRTPEGKPGYQPADGVNDAVETVERLRNQDGVDNVRIYRMEEVPFSYKVHYTVELGDVPAPEEPTVSLSGGGESLTWDDDGGASEPPAEESSDDAPGQPFDQMAAIDHTEPPRWGDVGESGGDEHGESPEGAEGEGESSTSYGEYSAATGYRRGLFGR